MPLFNGNAIPSASGAFEIEKSLRFDSNSNSKLSRTPSSAGNRRTYTISYWFKRSLFTSGSHMYPFDANGDGNVYILNSSEKIGSQTHGGGYHTTTRVIRDSTNWYHLIIAVDTTQGTSSNRVKHYLNGSQITDWDSNVMPSQNAQSNINNTVAHTIGGKSGGNYFDGYMAEFHLVDGQQLTPSDFGEFDEDWGHWKPKKYTGSHGSQGFYLNFANSLTQHTITRIGSVHSTSTAMIGSSSIDVTGTYGFSIADSPDWSPSGDFTYEMWIYMNGSQASWSNICGQMDSTNRGLEIGPDGSGNWMARHSLKGNLTVTQPSTNNWHHLAFCRQGNTARLYLNGTQVDTDTGYTGSLNNCADVLLFGNADAGFSQNFNGYLDEIRFSKVCRYPDGTTFTNFGQGGGTISNPTAFTSDDDTLLLIHSNTSNGSTTIEDSSGIGKTLGSDASGNNNHFTPTNIHTHDVFPDSPTNNFCTMNNLENYYFNSTFSEGNLKVATTGGSGNEPTIIATQAISSGKWYWETRLTGGSGTYALTGIAAQTGRDGNDAVGRFSDGYAYYGYGSGSGNIITNNNYSSYGSATSYSSGDVISLALDKDNNKMYWAKNGTWLNSANPASGSNGYSISANPHNGYYFPAIGDWGAQNVTFVCNFGQDSTYSGQLSAGNNSDGEGYGDFKYAVPSGFKALCAKNLPDPTVDVRDHFNIHTYTQSGSNNNGNPVTVTTPASNGLVWIKKRSGSNDPGVFDNIRGGSKLLAVNTSNNQETVGGGITFGTSSYTIGNDSGGYGFNNTVGATYVSWSWRANGSGSSNTTGSINSTVSANTAGGFSMVSYTGNGSTSQSIGHGLSSAPQYIATRNTGSGHVTRTGHGYFNDRSNPWHYQTFWSYNNGKNADTRSWQDTAPTSSVFYVGSDTDTNESGQPHIAYCWHEVDGVCKMGDYWGSGNSNGPFVYTGFEPELVHLKALDGAGGNMAHDRARTRGNNDSHAINPYFQFDGNGGESTGHGFDFLSNGFKIRGGNQSWNNSGWQYFFIAWAKHPLKYARAF